MINTDEGLSDRGPDNRHRSAESPSDQGLLAAREPIVAEEVVAEVAEVQHPATTAEAEARDVEAAARVAQLRPREQDVLTLQIDGDGVLLCEEGRHVGESEVSLELNRATAHRVAVDPTRVTVLEDWHETELAHIEADRWLHILEHFPLVGDELRSVDLARKLGHQLRKKCLQTHYDLRVGDEALSGLFAQIKGNERVLRELPDLIFLT